MSNQLGFAIIGTGLIADFHARALQDVNGARLVAVIGRSPEKTTAFGTKFGVPVVPDLEDLWRDQSVDVVCIATPSGAHAAAAVPALNAGKHVLCEKPLDISLDRIDAMIAAAQKNQRYLAGIFQSRFGPGAMLLKKAVDAGRFGRLTTCNAFNRFWRDQQYYDSVPWRGTLELDGGGALMNQGIHAVDLLQWLVGMPREVAGQIGTLAHDRIAAEDTASATLKFANGALGTLQSTTSNWPGFSRRIEISGDAGSAILENDGLVFWKFREETPDDEAIRSRFTTTPLTNSGAADPQAIPTEGHRLQMQDMVDAIREKRPPAIPGEEGRKAVQLVLAIYESARTGRKITL